MSTYKSEFKAKVEWVDIEHRILVVVYSDPYGHEDVTQSIAFKKSDTVEELRKAIINSTPHQKFHFRNEAYKQNPGDNTVEIVGMKDIEMTYKLPTFDNEDV